MKQTEVRTKLQVVFLKNEVKIQTYCSSRSPERWGGFPLRLTGRAASGCTDRRGRPFATAASRKGHMSKPEGCPSKPWKQESERSAQTQILSSKWFSVASTWAVLMFFCLLWLIQSINPACLLVLLLYFLLDLSVTFPCFSSVCSYSTQFFAPWLSSCRCGICHLLCVCSSFLCRLLDFSFRLLTQQTLLCLRVCSLCRPTCSSGETN